MWWVHSALSFPSSLILWSSPSFLLSLSLSYWVFITKRGRSTHPAPMVLSSEASQFCTCCPLDLKHPPPLWGKCLPILPDQLPCKQPLFSEPYIIAGVHHTSDHNYFKISRFFVLKFRQKSPQRKNMTCEIRSRFYYLVAEATSLGFSVPLLENWDKVPISRDFLRIMFLSPWEGLHKWSTVSIQHSGSNATALTGGLTGLTVIPQSDRPLGWFQGTCSL